MFYLFEYPRSAKAGTSYHDSIHSVTFETLFGALRCGYVSVTDNRDTHTRILFYFTYQNPVGFSRIHLCAGTSVNGQCLDTAVLQLFGKFDDDFVFGIPSQTGFYGNGNLNGINHGAGDFQHLRDILQHA